MLGRKKKLFTEEHKRRISIAKTKYPDNYCMDCNKQLKSKKSKRCNICSRIGEHNPFYGKKHSQEIKDIISYKTTGNRWKLTEEQRNRKCGINSHRYRGGITDIRKRIRGLAESNNWRRNIFIRDNFTCMECYIPGNGKNLIAHHIKRFNVLLTEFLSQYNQFSPTEDKITLSRIAINHKTFWDINNGITLCKECHTKEHTGEIHERKTRKATIMV